MHWDGSELGGFTAGKPWLPLDPNHASHHVRALSEDPRSILMLYRRLIELRGRHLSLSVGEYTPIAMQGDVLAYERRHGTECMLVVLNLGHLPNAVGLPAEAAQGRL